MVPPILLYGALSIPLQLEMMQARHYIRKIALSTSMLLALLCAVLPAHSQDTLQFASRAAAVRAADSVLAHMRTLPVGRDAYEACGWFLNHQVAVGNNRYLDSIKEFLPAIMQWAQQEHDTLAIIRIQHMLNGAHVLQPDYPALIEGAYYLLSLQGHLTTNDSLIA